MRIDRIEKFTELAEALTAGTISGKVEWQATASPNKYMSNTAHQSVMVTYYGVRESYSIEILDENGVEIAECSFYSANDTGPAKRLYKVIGNQIQSYIGIVDEYIAALAR